jgi:tagaturonate epimerase
MTIEPYTIGVGDRFAQQGRAQLEALRLAWQNGIRVYPVWNKSNREHVLIKSNPQDVRAEAENAVKALNWTGAFYVDADHINLKTVEGFAPASDFFTVDVADYVGAVPEAEAVESLVRAARGIPPNLSIPGLGRSFAIEETVVRGAAAKFLVAIQEAGRIYRRIAELKGPENFITEVSVDETDSPQNPAELLLILLMIREESIPVQTVAPKFTGRFNKGVDYAGDLAQFEKEFDEDLAVTRFAVREFGLPTSLKLSVHSGSDKFSLYPIINRLLKKHGAGLHVKTAGTTWLEEVVGLAEAGAEGLEMAKEIYEIAFNRFDELKAPYQPVIDIDPARLPDPKAVAAWDAVKYTNTLRHVESSSDYNPHFRQLLHIAFKVAAEMGDRFLAAVKANETTVSRNVTENLWDRHIRPIFS